MVMQISNADYNLLILREKLMMMMPGRGKRSRTCIEYGMMLMASHKSFSLLSERSTKGSTCTTITMPSRKSTQLSTLCGKKNTHILHMHVDIYDEEIGDG
jgi:hypothetical protein